MNTKRSENRKPSQSILISNRRRSGFEKVKEEVKEEIKEEVKEEVKEEIKEEVKEEVKEEIKEEIKREFKLGQRIRVRLNGVEYESINSSLRGSGNSLWSNENEYRKSCWIKINRELKKNGVSNHSGYEFTLI